MTKKQTATNNYSSQYQDPRWQKKRLEILERDEFTCHECGDSESTLHVHHKSYVYGKKVWDYPNENFVTLCEDCHNYYHRGLSGLDSAIANAKVFADNLVLCMIAEIINSVGGMDVSNADKVMVFAGEVAK